MFNPWNAANSGNAGDQSSRFPCVPPWTQFLSQSGWLNHGASMAPGINFNVMPRAPMSQAFVGGFPGFVPQSQPPPPPPPSNAASPPEPPKTNSQPPPPPSYPTSGVVSSRTMDFEKEWQKYQDSLQVGPNQSTSPSNATGNPQLQEVIEEENKFNEQFNEWKKQCESWKESNKSHPDKQLYYQYEQQWQQYEHQMLDRQNEIRQKKEQLMRSLQSQQRPATSQFQLSMPQSPASISGWQMPEVRPSNSQAHPNSQNWNQPGGKGEQVNFGQDINQRFQSAGQQYRPNNPQIEQRFAWQRHQRPLLDNPVECPGFMPRPQGNRFSSSLAQHQGPRMGNLRYKPPEPNPQLQPWSRSPGVHNRLVQPKATQISQVGPRPGNGDAKNVSLAPTPSLLGNPSMPRPRPLLADPNTIRNKSLQSPRIREEIPPRFGTPRRPPLLPGNEYEIESKRMRLSVPEHNMNLRAQQSPHKRFPPPPFVPRLPLTGGTILPDLRPRLQMMGPRFRRQGAAAVSQEFQSRNCSQEQVNTHKPHEADTGSSEFQGVLGEGAKKSEAESVDNSGGQTSKEENAKDHAIPEKQETNDLKVIEGDKLAASSSNATNYRPTDPKPVGESKMGHDTTDPANKVLQVHGENGAPVSEVPKEQVRRLSVGESTEINKEFVGSSKWNANPECDDKNYSCDVEDQWPGGRRRDSDLRGDRHFYEDKHQGEQGGGHAFKQPLHWESDQDWRDRSWSKNWSREPVVHDYQHQCAPFSADGMPMTEDKDERYPPGLFHPANNPYVATVIDYGHGGLEQDPPLISNRGFAAPPPLEEAIFKHDQDFRTPPPFFNRNTDFVPPPIHARELAPHHLQRIVPRPEEPLIEKIPIETLILPPGRTFRPDHLVIMVRGLPGAGKTYISKLIKEREIKEGGTAPRLLSLDDYFITEVEKVIEDPETGKKIKKMVMEYEYDQALEASYKTSFLKSFKKHVDDLYFTFIIVDATFDKKLYMDEFWNYAKSKGFQVYVIEVEADVNTCARRNDHQRTLTDIQKIKDGWDETPRHYLQLDAQFLLHGNIEEVEMDNSSAILEAEVAEQNNDPEEGDDSSEPGQQKSKWELDTSEQHLDKLDGLKTPKKVKTLEEYLQVPEDYEERSSIPGKKRVRWADIEEKKELERMRKLGFVVGYTDWDKLNDDSCAEKALIKTKYI